MFNATFNNISVISWLSVLLVEETGVPRENHRPAAIRYKTSVNMTVSNIVTNEREMSIKYRNYQTILYIYCMLMREI
jgi:hypothetical protein